MFMRRGQGRTAVVAGMGGCCARLFSTRVSGGQTQSTVTQSVTPRVCDESGLAIARMQIQDILELDPHNPLGTPRINPATPPWSDARDVHASASLEELPAEPTLSIKRTRLARAVYVSRLGDRTLLPQTSTSRTLSPVAMRGQPLSIVMVKTRSSQSTSAIPTKPSFVASTTSPGEHSCVGLDHGISATTTEPPEYNRLSYSQKRFADSLYGVHSKRSTESSSSSLPHRRLTLSPATTQTMESASASSSSPTVPLSPATNTTDGVDCESKRATYDPSLPQRFTYPSSTSHRSSLVHGLYTPPSAPLHTVGLHAHGPLRFRPETVGDEMNILAFLQTRIH